MQMTLYNTLYQRVSHVWHVNEQVLLMLLLLLLLF